MRLGIDRFKKGSVSLLGERPEREPVLFLILTGPNISNEETMGMAYNGLPCTEVRSLIPGW